jgi:hypothetical protein
METTMLDLPQNSAGLLLAIAERAKSLSAYIAWVGGGLLLQEVLDAPRQQPQEGDEAIPVSKLDHSASGHDKQPDGPDAPTGIASSLPHQGAAQFALSISESGHGEAAFPFTASSGQFTSPLPAVQLLAQGSHLVAHAKTATEMARADPISGAQPFMDYAFDPLAWADVQMPGWADLISGFADLQLFDEIVIPWDAVLASATQPALAGVGNYIAGAYADVQVVLDFSSLTSAAADHVHGLAALYSNASNMDLVLVAGNFYEINIVVQFNLAGPDASWQDTAGTIIDQHATGGAQLSLGGETNIAAVDQLNLAWQSQAVSQFNQAVIHQYVSDAVDFDSADGIAASPMPQATDAMPGWLSGLQHLADTSVLVVDGDYYEVNLLVQLLDGSADGAHGADALLQDFDGIAQNQIVLGETFDLSAVVQLNTAAGPGSLTSAALLQQLSESSSTLANLINSPAAHGTAGNPLDGYATT